MPGLAARLKHEVKERHGLDVRVIDAPRKQYVPWVGASHFAHQLRGMTGRELSDHMVTRKEFDEYGVNCIHRLAEGRKKPER